MHLIVTNQMVVLVVMLMVPGFLLYRIVQKPEGHINGQIWQEPKEAPSSSYELNDEK